MKVVFGILVGMILMFNFMVMIDGLSAKEPEKQCIEVGSMEFGHMDKQIIAEMFGGSDHE